MSEPTGRDPDRERKRRRRGRRPRGGAKGKRDGRNTPPAVSPDAKASADNGAGVLSAPDSKASAAPANTDATHKPSRGARSGGAATPARRARAELETSAGGIVYRVHDGEALFLLIRDSYRNWGFPKGHLELDEGPEAAALREVQEETGLMSLEMAGEIETIDWYFRFRGKLVHKVCHFYLMRSQHARTTPQREEGITACRWARYEDATRLISYANARAVLHRAHAMVQNQVTPSEADG